MFLIHFLLIICFSISCRPGLAQETDRKSGSYLETLQDYAYMPAVQKKIKSNWHPPRRKTSSCPELNFTIDSAGKVTWIEIAKSSNDQEVDKAAKQAILDSQPFPPTPAKNSLSINFSFQYNVFDNGLADHKAANSSINSGADKRKGLWEHAKQAFQEGSKFEIGIYLIMIAVVLGATAEGLRSLLKYTDKSTDSLPDNQIAQIDAKTFIDRDD